MVKNGYVDDLKKAHPGIVVADAIETKVDGAPARLVRSTFAVDARKRQETALLIVRGDHVLILRSQSTLQMQAITQAAFDTIVASVRWSR